MHPSSLSLRTDWPLMQRGLQEKKVPARAVAHGSRLKHGRHMWLSRKKVHAVGVKIYTGHVGRWYSCKRSRLAAKSCVVMVKACTEDGVGTEAGVVASTLTDGMQTYIKGGFLADEPAAIIPELDDQWRSAALTVLLPTVGGRVDTLSLHSSFEEQTQERVDVPTESLLVLSEFMPLFQSMASAEKMSALQTKKKQCPYETLLAAEAAFHEYSGTLSSAERAFKHALLTLSKDKSKTATRVDAICTVVRAKITTKLFDGMRDLGQTVIADLQVAADEARELGVEKMIEEWKLWTWL